MMETMQQMELLCGQRKSKNSCDVFHLDSKDSGFVQLFPKLHTHRIDAIPDAALVRRTIREAVT